MLGTNELHLNKASMNDVLQAWVDAQMKDKQRVIDVTWHPTFAYFIVKLDAVEQDTND
jgi:hypothetical protein